MIRLKFLLILLLVVASWSAGQAQTEAETPAPRNQLGIDIGLGQSYLKDLNYSPLNHAGRGVALGLGYWRVLKNEDLLYAKIDLAQTILQTDVSAFFSADRYNANVELGYLKGINLASDKFMLYLGGGYHTYLDVVFYDGTESVTFFTVHGIDIAGNLFYPINDKHSLGTSLSIPIFGLLVRPPYTGWDKFIVERADAPVGVFFRGKWTSLNDYFGLNWGLTYQYKLSAKWDFKLEYRFRYYKTETLDLAKSINTQLNFGTNVNF